MFNFKGNIFLKVLRTLIIDDEGPVRETLARMLQIHCPNVRVVGQADGVRSGVEAIREHHPDLILLDIRMADGTGFDLLEQAGADDYKVIFITAYHEYAIKAIRFSALDFLLKPIDSSELTGAVERAEAQVVKEMKVQYDTLVENLKTSDRSQKKIILKTKDNVHLIRISDILCCESDGRYTVVYLRTGERIMVSVTLKHYQDILGEYGFYRAHKSFLVNLEHIMRFEKTEGGHIIMGENLRIPVASRKREELLELFDRIAE